MMIPFPNPNTTAAMAGRVGVPYHTALWTGTEYLLVLGIRR
jgi:hypothetical protein